MTPQYGQRIRSIRKSLGLTQELFAQQCGISLTSLRRYESNDRQPNISTLEDIAHKAGMSLQDFLWADLDGSNTHNQEPIRQRLLSAFDQLNPEGQQKAVERVEELTEIPKYQKKPQD